MRDSLVRISAQEVEFSPKFLSQRLLLKENISLQRKVTTASLSAEVLKTESTTQIGSTSNFTPLQRQRSGLLPWCGAGAHSQPVCPWHLALPRTAPGTTLTVPRSCTEPLASHRSQQDKAGLATASALQAPRSPHGHIWPSSAQLEAPSLTSSPEKEAAVPLTKTSGISTTQVAEVLMLRDEVVSSEGSGGVSSTQEQSLQVLLPACWPSSPPSKGRLGREKI